MQFSDRLRKRYAKLHRVAGRIYVVGALVSAPLGAYIQYFEEGMNGPRSFTIASVVDALSVDLDHGDRLPTHPPGQSPAAPSVDDRSFAVALVFVEVRVIAGITGTTAIETIVWSCLAFSVFLADMVLQIQEALRARSPVNRTRVATARQTIVVR